MGFTLPHLLIDHDPRTVAGFDEVLDADGVKGTRGGPRAPNPNAFAERWVPGLRRDALDHFSVLGEPAPATPGG